MERDRYKRNILLFLASQNISLFGSMLVQYAIIWHITLETQSGSIMTISIICGFVPTLFISPFAGVWADRFNRKLLIVYSDALIASVTLITALVFALGHSYIWLLFVSLAVRAFGSGIQTPSVSALIPQIVPKDELMRVNGIFQSIQSFVAIISPMLSGVLLTFSTIETIFLIDVATAAIAIWILLIFLRIPLHEKAKNREPVSYFSDLGKGLSYIHTHGFLKILFSFCAVYFVLVSPVAFLTPLQVTRNYGVQVWRLTAIEVAFSGGMMLGGLAIASWGGFRNRIHTMILSTTLFGISITLIAFSLPFWIYLSLMAFMGIFMPLFNTPFTVLIQEHVHQDYLGRVFGVFSMISSSIMPMSMIIFGPLADVVDIEWMLLATGLLMIIQSFAMHKSKKLIEAGMNHALVSQMTSAEGSIDQ